MKFTDLPLHHAVLIVSQNRTTVDKNLFNELKSISPAHRFFNQTVLDIESARAIIAWANTAYNEEKIALLSFHTIGLEAQNALLKLLEEPRAGVRFILVTSNISNLIPTVLSRVLVIESNENTEVILDAELFLHTSHTLRMKLPFVSTLLSQVDEEDRKDREAVKAFVTSLATVLGKKGIESKYILETIDIASYAADPSASGKALLEYLSLLLPQTRD